MANNHVELTAQDARQGETPGMVRRVLRNSLIIAVVGMAIAAWILS